MAKSNDPLIESLMQLAVAAAPLVRKAREAGIFRREDDMVDAEVVTPRAAEPPPAPTPPEPPKADAPAAPGEPSAQAAAMQDIIVRQALRINELEAEVAKLKAAAARPAKPKAKAGNAPKPNAAPAKTKAAKA